MAMWNPWRGCHRHSEGCRNCYLHKGDSKRGVDTNLIVRAEKGFDAPIARNRRGEFSIASGQTVYICFSSDFLIEEADSWRQECWAMMRMRPDLHFIFLTKRIERLVECLPEDWGQGYDNVTIGCSVENQDMADKRLPVFLRVPVRHRNIILQPLVDAVDIAPYLEGVELVTVGGEYGPQARPLYYEWVLDVRKKCIEHDIAFIFRQAGTYFVKDGQMSKLSYAQLTTTARACNIAHRAQRGSIKKED